MDTGDRRLWASGTFDAMEALEMIQVELGGTFERTGQNRVESGGYASVSDAVPGASRSKMGAKANAPRPHVEPDWREE